MLSPSAWSRASQRWMDFLWSCLLRGYIRRGDARLRGARGRCKEINAEFRRMLPFHEPGFCATVEMTEHPFGNRHSVFHTHGLLELLELFGEIPRKVMSLGVIR